MISKMICNRCGIENDQGMMVLKKRSGSNCYTAFCGCCDNPLITGIERLNEDEQTYSDYDSETTCYSNAWTKEMIEGTGGTDASNGANGVCVGHNAVFIDSGSFMTDDQLFNEVLTARQEKTREVLTAKAEEYANKYGRFHNFIVAGMMDDETPEQALWGMLKKHIVSVKDLVEWTEDEEDRITAHLINEKIGDTINYLHLLEALLIKRLRDNGKTDI